MDLKDILSIPGKVVCLKMWHKSRMAQSLNR